MQVCVFMHVDVVRMGEVDTKNQKFESEMKIFSRWLEPALDHKQAHVSVIFLQHVRTQTEHNIANPLIVF